MRKWVDRALADEVERDDALDALRTDLKSLRSGEHCAHEIHELLADRRLDALRDRHGRNMRALAVAALVRMGYPWALRVAPEDLELLRVEQSSAKASMLRGVNAVLALGPMLVMALGAASLVLFPPNLLTGAVLLVVFCSAAVVVGMLGAILRRHARRGFQSASLIGCIVCLVMWFLGMMFAPLDLMVVCSLPAAICALVAGASSVVTPSPIDA
ncbi:MAG: hypothetical protein IPJ65_00250 [Archangiaceae bacterium]|nr:hypothetical protein [Archangiaceae bacterium]